MTVQLDGDVACDADLADAATRGDRAAFADIYDRYADRLHDHCVGMVGHRDAADCVQDAFCMAAIDLPTLSDPSKLRPWLGPCRFGVMRVQIPPPLSTRGWRRWCAVRVGCRSASSIIEDPVSR
jgi:hypothetical protein